MAPTPREIRLLLAAAPLLITATILLRISSFSRTQSLAHHIPRAATTPSNHRDLRQAIAWAVQTASTHLPGTYRCLPTALAAQALLIRYGQPAALQLGAIPTPTGVAAHAWVTSGPDIVVGDDVEFHRITRFRNPPT